MINTHVLETVKKRLSMQLKLLKKMILLFLQEKVMRISKLSVEQNILIQMRILPLKQQLLNLGKQNKNINKKCAEVQTSNFRFFRFLSNDNTRWKVRYGYVKV